MDLWAEAYILRTIGELDDRTAQNLMKKVPPETARTIDEALRMYEREESISVDAIEWIRAEWSEAQGRKPKAFAKAIMDDFHAAIE